MVEFLPCLHAVHGRNWLRCTVNYVPVLNYSALVSYFGSENLLTYRVRFQLGSAGSPFPLPEDGLASTFGS